MQFKITYMFVCFFNINYSCDTKAEFSVFRVTWSFRNCFFVLKIFLIIIENGVHCMIFFFNMILNAFTIVFEQIIASFLNKSIKLLQKNTHKRLNSSLLIHDFKYIPAFYFYFLAVWICPLYVCGSEVCKSVLCRVVFKVSIGVSRRGLPIYLFPWQPFPYWWERFCGSNRHVS